jgi:copper chaperone NosL
MKRAIALILLLAACREDVAAVPSPVEMTAQTLGYYCQMNVLEHPGPKAQVHLAGQPGAPLFFSQVRDAVAYQRMPEQSAEITAIYVNDMGVAPSWDDPGTGNWVPLDQVQFVVGSDQTGGMGVAELVPFHDPAQAAAFVAAHGGVVMSLADIPDADVVPPTTDTGTDDQDYTDRLRKLDEKTGG